MKISLLYLLIIILFAGCKLSDSKSSEAFNRQEVQNVNTVSQISLIRDVSSDGLSINELEAVINDAEKQGNVGARSHIHQY